MPRCECGSYAINVDKSGGKCDVCFYKDALGDVIAMIKEGGYVAALQLAEEAYCRIR